MKDYMPVNGQFAMPTLGYDNLGDVISKETLGFHYGKHLKAYVDNLNKLLPGSGLEGLSLIEVVKKAEGGMFNNAGQVLNHTLYFEQFSNTPKAMSTKLTTLLERDFGSVEAFKKEFEQKGTTLFGSGWVWLSADKDGKLHTTEERRKPCHHGSHTSADLRRVGACLLSRLSEPSGRPPRRPVANCRLGHHRKSIIALRDCVIVLLRKLLCPNH